MGDFNMVETRADKSFQCGRLLSGRERALFNSLKEALKIMEPIRAKNGLHFTWDNLCFNGVRVLARLDECCAFESSMDHELINYRIHGDSIASSHTPISISIQLGPELLRPSW